jgi:hypothetical protein
VAQFVTGRINSALQGMVLYGEIYSALQN